MILENVNLEKWLEDAVASEYYNHKKIEYYDSYKTFKKEAIKIHDSVTSAANFKEAQNGNLIFMNDHGPKHIETVIDRASKLVEANNCKLNPKEVYYLLTAIHLHDIGNLYGRINHVTDMVKILGELEGFIDLDAIEKRHIRNIAEAHGGRLPNGDKDKIDVLDEKANTLEGPVRIQLLASILRLADELADDKNRANTPLLKIDGLGDSTIYHAYSYCLTNVLINHGIKQIELQFDIPKGFATKTYQKDGKKIYLLDEIYSRVLKMHHERHYTMRFTRGLIDLNTILTRIEFYPDKIADGTLGMDKITFELKEKGYPGTSKKTIFQICDTLVQDGRNINGSYIKQKIVKSQK